jgi:hypothetical protein
MGAAAAFRERPHQLVAGDCSSTCAIQAELRLSAKTMG